MPDAPTWPLRTVTAATETPRERALRLGREDLDRRVRAAADAAASLPDPNEGTTP